MAVAVTCSPALSHAHFTGTTLSRARLFFCSARRPVSVQFSSGRSDGRAAKLREIPPTSRPRRSRYHSYRRPGIYRRGTPRLRRIGNLYRESPFDPGARIPGVSRSHFSLYRGPLVVLAFFFSFFYSPFWICFGFSFPTRTVRHDTYSAQPTGTSVVLLL